MLSFNAMSTKILVVDDEVGILKLFQKALRHRSREILTARDGEEALVLMKTEAPSLIILDLKLPDIDGMDVLRQIMQMNHDTCVIILTGYGNTNSTIQAMRLGAYDYITKPFDLFKVKIIIEKALERRALTKELNLLKKELRKFQSTDSIIGHHAKMQQIYKMIGQIADRDSAVLIRGETGTGKELIAKTIHQNSYRNQYPFVVVDCAYFPETLLESELFGHERGAFTGAYKKKIGKFELADKGTLFLDEIGNISLTTQAKLLRFLQEKTFERIGGNQNIKVDTRIIAATSLNIEQAVEEKKFREDLFYRLNVIPITLPPLRERRVDIPLLAEYFFRIYSNRSKSVAQDLAPEVFNCLMKYDWPGNVRELQNVIERAVVTAKGKVVTLENFPRNIQNSNKKKKTDSATGYYHIPIKPNEKFDSAVEHFEKQLIENALIRSDWSQTKAAKLLGMSFRSVRYRIKKYKISVNK